MDIKQYKKDWEIRNKEKRWSQKLQREATAEYKKKNKSRKALAWAIRSGKMQRFPCCVCGNPKSEAHHNNYDLPFDVIWYCREHHTETHKMLRK